MWNLLRVYSRQYSQGTFLHTCDWFIYSGCQALTCGRACPSTYEIVAGDAQERSWVSKTKLTLEPNWILSLLGLLEYGCHLTVGCAVQSLNTNNHTYVTKLHKCTLSPLSLSLTHIMCYSNNYPVPPTVPLLPTKYRVERLYPPWVNVSVTCDPRGDLGWLLDNLAGTEGEHAVCPLLSVKINVALELLRRQSWIGK